MHFKQKIKYLSFVSGHLVKCQTRLRNLFSGVNLFQVVSNQIPSIMNVYYKTTALKTFTVDVDQTYKKYNLQMEGMTYYPYSGSIESVVNSNALQLIQDEELQKYLVSWKDVFRDYKEDEKVYYDYLTDFLWPYYRDAFDTTGKDTAMNLATRNTIKFQNMIITRRNNIRGIIRAIEDEPIENHINEIIRLTEPTN